MPKVKTRYNVLMGDFNAKVGKKQAGDQAEEKYGVGSRNSRGELLVEFAERNNLSDSEYLIPKKGEPELYVEVPEWRE